MCLVPIVMAIGFTGTPSVVHADLGAAWPSDSSAESLGLIQRKATSQRHVALESSPNTIHPKNTRVFELQIEGGYVTSLFYLIENISRSRILMVPGPYYREFWAHRFGLDQRDESLLKSYVKLHEKYAPIWTTYFVGSRTLDECWEKAGRDLDPAELDTLKQLFNRFDENFRPYWLEHSARLIKAQNELQTGSISNAIAGYLDEVADFFELTPNLRRRYTVVLLWHPGMKASGGNTKGLRLGQLLLVEIPEDRNLENQIDVVIHECVHDLQAAIPQEVRESLSVDLLSSDRHAGEYFLRAMNEGLSTAFGALFLQRYISSHFDMNRSWYASDVDKFAKAVFPVVGAALRERATLRTRGQQLLEAIRSLAE